MASHYLAFYHAMRFQSKTHISPLLTIESPVAQWLEYSARSHRVISSNTIWISDFSSSFQLMLFHSIKI